MKLSDFYRNFWFAYYALKPFRFSMVSRHLYHRLKSFFTPHRGFRIIDLAVGYDCNLTCGHCSAAVLKGDGKPLCLDEYKRIVTDAKKLDNLSWNITGGEPLLIPWLDELIRILEPKRHYITVQTNGMLLTYKRAKQLAKQGVNCISTSLDSIDKEEHNRFRGNHESYDRVLMAIENAKRAGMQVLVCGTVTHSNIRSNELEALIQKVNALGAIFLFNLAVPCGNWQKNREVILTSEDRKYLEMLMDNYPMTSTDHDPGRNKNGCPAGMEKIYITPYGDVIPCPFIHVAFGNVREQRLTDIVHKMRRVPYFGKYQNICVAAEDREFHSAVFSKISGLSDDTLPVPCDMIFNELSDSKRV